MNKKWISIILIFILLVGCSKANNSVTKLYSSERSVTFNAFYITLMGQTQEDMYDAYTTSEEFHFNKVIKNEDGSITIIGTEDQFDAITRYNQKELQTLQSRFADLQDNYKIIVNEEYTNIDYYFEPNNIDSLTVSFYVFEAIIYTSYCQMFSGVNDGDGYTLFFNIYNSDTNNLVISHDIKNLGEYLYTEEDWEKSYE